MDDLSHTLQAMLRFGGSFDRALALAAMRADPDNLRRLRDAFPELFAQFEKAPA